MTSGLLTPADNNGIQDKNKNRIKIFGASLKLDIPPEPASEAEERR